MVTTSLIHRLSQTIDRIENRSQPRAYKVVKVRRGYKEDPDAARERHYATHPEDRGADVLIWEFHSDDEMAGESTHCRAQGAQRATNPKASRALGMVLGTKPVSPPHCASSSVS